MTIEKLFRIAPVTTVLIALFVCLFIIQILTGVDINNPDVEDLIIWGANYFELTLSNEPWRLITSAFLHIGLIHILLNSFVMYYFGQIAEINFGSFNLLILFILSAIGGNILNSYITVWNIYNNNAGGVIAAGASGGIMGIGMALLVSALLRKFWTGLNRKGVDLDLRNLAIVMGINLMSGFAIPGIDNAAHIGGAITGALLAISMISSDHLYNTYHNRIIKLLPSIISLVLLLLFYKIWLDLHLLLRIY